MNVLFIRTSEITNSEHKLRQFSNSLTFYFRILGSASVPVLINTVDVGVDPQLGGLVDIRGGGGEGGGVQS